MIHTSNPPKQRDRSMPLWSEIALPMLKVPRGTFNLTHALLRTAVFAMLGLGVIFPLNTDRLFSSIGVEHTKFIRDIPLQGMRGSILDRNGLVLAENTQAHSIFVSPREFRASSEQRAVLAKELGISTTEFEKRISSSKVLVKIANNIDSEKWAAINAMNIPGIVQSLTNGRRYPQGESAAHLVGFVNIDGRGQEGIELALEGDLRETAGSQTTVRGQLGNIYWGDTTNATNGRDVQLSIDSRVQFFAYQRIRDAVIEHNAIAGSVIVIDAISGDVIAVTNYPSFDLINRQALYGENLRNRAITDIFEPGSTIKPFVAALALQLGSVTPSTIIDTTPGRIVISGYTIRDPSPNGNLTVAELIQKSSNVGTVKMAMSMQPRELWDFFASLGFGQRPQISFPGVVTGRMRPYRSWRPIEQATMSYGYGLSTSLLQVAQAYTVFARDGEVISASLLKQNSIPTGLPVLRPEVASEVRTMLKMASGPGGTSPKAQTLGYSVGGMSATVQKQMGRGYANNRFRASYVGIAPIDKPRIVVAVMLDEPRNGSYYGGDVAAPVFSQIAQQSLRILGVKPDLDIN